MSLILLSPKPWWRITAQDSRVRGLRAVRLERLSCTEGIEAWAYRGFISQDVFVLFALMKAYYIYEYGVTRSKHYTNNIFYPGTVYNTDGLFC